MFTPNHGEARFPMYDTDPIYTRILDAYCHLCLLSHHTGTLLWIDVVTMAVLL